MAEEGLAPASPTGGWKASLFIMALECCERMAAFAIGSNLITYLTDVLHEGIATSARSVNNWFGVTTVLPLLGGFLADAYFGRYWTVVVSSVVYLLGLGLLIIVVSLPALRPPPCPPSRPLCGNAKPAEIRVLFGALYIISFGAGGHKPCLGSYGPDQFDEENPKERLQKASFFNWLFTGVSCGFLLGATVVVYVEENVSWGAGFGIVTAAFAISFCAFLYGSRFYRHKPPAGSPIGRIMQVFVAALSKRHLQLPNDESLLRQDSDLELIKPPRPRLPHTQSFRFLDKAALVQESSDSIQANGHSEACTVTQVEEVKKILRMVPIWLTCLPYSVALAQGSTLFIKQSGTMDRSMGPNFKLPQASVIGIGLLTTLLFLPLYERFLVPIARIFTGNERGISILQRIGVGLFFSIVALAVAALVESMRLETANRRGLRDKPHATIPLSVFWLAPQYIVMGVADAFIFVGMQEFFYSQMPDTMRSSGIAVYLSVIGVGSFLSSALITIADEVSRRGPHHSWFDNNLNRGHLDYFFWLLAILSTINYCIFLYIAIRKR